MGAVESGLPPKNTCIESRTPGYKLNFLIGYILTSGKLD
jgi:hypothetical protein